MPPYTRCMGILDFAARVRFAVKLHRGQCRWCFKPLPEASSSKFCDMFCEDAYRVDQHPII